VEANRPTTIKRQATQQDDTCKGIFGLRQASTRQVVVNEPLGEESSEQALDDPVRKVELHRVPVESRRWSEHDRPERCLAPPLIEGLVVLRWRSEGIKRGRPAGIVAMASLEIREDVTHGLTRRRRRFAKRFGLEEVERAVQGIAKLDFIQANPSAGILDAVAKRSHFTPKAGLPFLGGLVQFGLTRCSLFRIFLQAFNFSGSGLNLSTSNARAKPLLDDLGQAAKL
jgi:hypothetical protein